MIPDENKIVIKGKAVDDETRCVHYHSPQDIMSIKFKCCNEYYPCFYCHKEETEHEAEIWKKNEHTTKAILCGVCKNEMAIDQYLNCNHQCPFCSSQFNPNCAKHYQLYFEL